MGGSSPVEQGIGGDLLPKGAQLRDPCAPFVSRDDGCVDGANGDAGDPVGIDVGLSKGLIDAGLVGPECTPALQD
jgi:hypothetical protein